MKRTNNNLLLLSFFIPSLFFSSLAQPAEDDIKCLQGLKARLSDPQHKLTSWTFSNPSLGFLCKFVGVSCWNEVENRLISIDLTSMHLGGELPDSLQFCRSLNSLNLSGNALSGTIPTKICNWLPFLVNLDLSGNNFTGPIPSELSECTYLNNLNLGHNSLSGKIPYQLSSISRLKKFSVANNQLSGQIPLFLSNFSSSGFEGNSGLCGRPLKSKCDGTKQRMRL